MFDKDQNSTDSTKNKAKEIADQIRGFIKDGKNITVNIPPEINREEVQTAVLVEVDGLSKQDRNSIPDKLLNDVVSKIRTSNDGRVEIPSTDLPKYSGLESINSKKESVDLSGNKPSKETTVYEKPGSKTTISASKQAGEFQNIEESQPQSDMNDKPDRIVIRISSKKVLPSKNEKTNKAASAIDSTMGRGAKTGVEQKRIEESARLLWRRGTDPEKLKQAIGQSSATLKEGDREDLLKIAKELEKLNKAFPDITKDFQQAAGKSDDYVIEKRSGEAYSYEGNEVSLEKTNRGIQVAPSEWSSPDIYDPEYTEASEDYVEEISSYSNDFDDREIPSDYKEPDMSPPQGSSYPVNHPSSVDHETSPPRQTINSISNAGKQMASNAVNSAKTNAKIATRKGLQKLALAAAPILANIALGIAIAGAAIMAFFAWLATVIITILLWAAGFIAFVVIILFIINSGAYMVPPGEDLTQFANILEIGENGCTIDTGCPCGWPIRTDTGQSYYITQGPQVNPSLTACTHFYLEAIDIASGRNPNFNDVIVATHPGRITQIGIDGYGGLWLEITGECNNHSVRSWHVHFDSFSPNIGFGSEVERGTILGVMGTTGYSSGPHDHYEFRTGALMTPPFLPEVVPYGCCSFTGCGSMTIP